MVVLFGTGAYFYMSSKSNQQQDSSAKVFKTDSITRTGVLNSSSVKGVDYKHTITEGSKVYGVTSGLESLDKYVGKRVEAIGQNSGTTLYIDTIKIVE